MNLKSALFEIKEALKNQQIEPIEDQDIKKIEENNQLSPGSLVYYVNNLMLLQKHQEEHTSQAGDETKKVNRKWTKVEMDFMFHYIKERQEEGALNITELLEEVAQLLNRGYQSVNYKYYSLVKAKEKKPSYQFTTIAQQQVPVVSTEVIRGPVFEDQQAQVQPKQDDDLLDTLSGLITNVQQLPDINLNGLIKSLYHLTNMALQNKEIVQEFEKFKYESDVEKNALQEKLMYKEKQLKQERMRNDALHEEVAKLVKEITAFNQLGDAAKIQNLKSYNQNLNYIIDGSGVVLKVGS